VEWYCVALPKSPKKTIPLVGYLVIKHHGLTLLEEYCLCSKLHNTPTIPLISCPITRMGSIHIFSNLEGFCITIPKPRRKTILASYCDNILNHETKGFFKNIYAMFNITCLTY
jgi:hypothetical protein